MRKAIVSAVSAMAFAAPAAAADLSVPRYSEIPRYEYRAVPPVVVEEEAPFIVAPAPVVVEEYPVYAAPRIYAAPLGYAYAGPVWRSHRHHFHGRW